MNYGEVLSRAWQITWKYKILWLFGLLASCSAGGPNNTSSYSIDNPQELENIQNYLPRGLQPYGDQIERFFASIPEEQLVFLGIMGACLAFFFVLLGIMFTTVGRIGLIKGTYQAEQGASSLSLSTLFSDSLPYFWRMLGLSLVLMFLFIVVGGGLALVFTTFTVLTIGIALVCLIPIICLLIPAAWVLSVVIEQANVALVVEDLGIFEALSRGWEVFKENLGEMIVMGLILLFGVGLLGGFLVALPMMLPAAPVAFGFVSGTETGMRSGLLVAAALFLFALPFVWLLSGILQTFTQASWALTFLRLRDKDTREVLPVAVMDEVEITPAEPEEEAPTPDEPEEPAEE
jgi:hypothetical protein